MPFGQPYQQQGLGSPIPDWLLQWLTGSSGPQPSPPNGVRPAAAPASPPPGLAQMRPNAPAAYAQQQYMNQVRAQEAAQQPGQRQLFQNIMKDWGEKLGTVSPMFYSQLFGAAGGKAEGVANLIDWGRSLPAEQWLTRQIGDTSLFGSEDVRKVGRYFDDAGARLAKEYTPVSLDQASADPRRYAVPFAAQSMVEGAGQFAPDALLAAAFGLGAIPSYYASSAGEVSKNNPGMTPGQKAATALPMAAVEFGLGPQRLLAGLGKLTPTRWLASSLEEGGEEFMQGLIERAGQYLTGQPMQPMDQFVKSQTEQATKATIATLPLGVGGAMVAGQQPKAQPFAGTLADKPITAATEYTGPGLDIGKATELLAQPEHLKGVERQQQIDRQNNLPSKVYGSTVGAFSGNEGTVQGEPSALTVYSPGTSIEEVRAAAAQRGLDFNQMAVLNFTPAKEAGHTLYAVDIPKSRMVNHTTLSAGLQKAGIPYFTLVDHGKSYSVVVADTDGSMYDPFQNFTRGYNAQAHTYPGNVEFIGSDSREAARGDYERVLAAKAERGRNDSQGGRAYADNGRPAGLPEVGQDTVLPAAAPQQAGQQLGAWQTPGESPANRQIVADVPATQYAGKYDFTRNEPAPTSQLMVNPTESDYRRIMSDWRKNDPARFQFMANEELPFRAVKVGDEVYAIDASTHTHGALWDEAVGAWSARHPGQSVPPRSYSDNGFIKIVNGKPEYVPMTQGAYDEAFGKNFGGGPKTKEQVERWDVYHTGDFTKANRATILPYMRDFEGPNDTAGYVIDPSKDDIKRLVEIKARKIQRHYKASEFDAAVLADREGLRAIGALDDQGKPHLIIGHAWDAVHEDLREEAVNNGLTPLQTAEDFIHPRQHPASVLDGIVRRAQKEIGEINQWRPSQQDKVNRATLAPQAENIPSMTPDQAVRAKMAELTKQMPRLERLVKVMTLDEMAGRIQESFAELHDARSAKWQKLSDNPDEFNANRLPLDRPGYLEAWNKLLGVERTQIWEAQSDLERILPNNLPPEVMWPAKVAVANAALAGNSNVQVNTDYAMKMGLVDRKRFTDPVKFLNAIANTPPDVLAGSLIGGVPNKNVWEFTKPNPELLHSLPNVAMGRAMSQHAANVAANNPTGITPEGKPVYAPYGAGMRFEPGTDKLVERGMSADDARKVLEALTVYTHESETSQGTDVDQPDVDTTPGIAVRLRQEGDRATRMAVKLTNAMGMSKLFQKYGGNLATPELEAYRVMMHELGHVLDKMSGAMRKMLANPDKTAIFRSGLIKEMVKLSMENRPMHWKALGQYALEQLKSAPAAVKMFDDAQLVEEIHRNVMNAAAQSMGGLARGMSVYQAVTTGERYIDFPDGYAKRIKQFIARIEKAGSDPVDVLERIGYIARFDELLADSMARYLMDPGNTKMRAPKYAAWAREYVNNDPTVGKVVNLSGMALAPLAGLAGGGDDEMRRGLHHGGRPMNATLH